MLRITNRGFSAAWHPRRGQESLSVVVLLAVASLVMVGVYNLMTSGSSKEDPNTPAVQPAVQPAAPPGNLFRNITVVVTIVGAACGVIAWGTNRVFDLSRKRAEMIVLELLSDGKPRTFRGLTQDACALARGHGIRMFPGGYKDAIASLVDSRRIVADDGKYSLANAK